MNWNVPYNTAISGNNSGYVNNTGANTYGAYYGAYQNSAPIIAYVQGEVGGKSFQLPRNSIGILIDTENPVFYIKSTDVYGMPSPLRTFEYSERMQQADPVAFNPNMFPPSQDSSTVSNSANDSTSIPVDDSTGVNDSNTNYITREEFENLENKLNELEDLKMSFKRNERKNDVGNPTNNNKKRGNNS